MDKGEEISEDLKRAIFDSRVCMPILSKNYASSKACLLEISHMVQCEKKIIPIFYDVTPNDVKLKTSLYKEHLKDYQGNPKIELDEVVKWEKALVMVAKISGYDLHDKDEAEEITSITRDLVIQLMPKHQDVIDKLVETEYEVKHVEELLDLSCNDFRVIGIFGMGGIGKTTLAKVIFNRLEHSFPSCCCFLENVRENWQSNKLLDLQRQLYEDVINPKLSDSINGCNHGISMIKYGLANKKALLVLDDIDEEKQLTDLLGNDVCFKSGSRLMITTRDKRILDLLGRKYNVLAYGLKEMDKDRSLKLFSKHAFMKDFPPEDFRKLSEKVVSYALGIPLAIEVFGSSLYDKSKDDWKGILEALKKNPGKRIEDIMMVSYQGLNPDERNIFLDIACYYGNLDKENACYMWEDCGWFPQLAIRALENRSLIKIDMSTDRESLWMHDVLKDLGRSIIRAQSDKSGKVPNRLRIQGSLDILYETKERAHVEILTIHDLDIKIKREDMVGLQNLRFLVLCVEEFEGDFNGLFPNLRWFRCDNFREYKPINFNPKKLVVLDVWANSFKKEGMRTMKADKLKALYLRGNVGWSRSSQHENIEWIPNAINLERLCLRIGRVIGLEDMGKLSRLTDLNLWLVKFRYLPYLPSSLLFLVLEDCEFVKGILDVSNLKNLISFDIKNTKKLNDIIGLEKLYSLEILRLKCFDYIDSCRTKWLNINNVLSRGYLKNVKELQIFDTLNELPDVPSMKKLIALNLTGMERILSFNGLESLELLYIHYCPSLEILPDLSALRKLRGMGLERCDKLRSIQGIPQLESLEFVEIIYCNSLELGSLDFTKLEKVQSVYIEKCDKLQSILKGHLAQNNVEDYGSRIISFFPKNLL